MDARKAVRDTLDATVVCDWLSRQMDVQLVLRLV